MRGLLLALLLLFAAGCHSYHYVVRTDRAPLYADSERGEVVARLERLDAGFIGHTAPKGDPVKIRYHGRTGWANRKDLRIFKTHDDSYEVREALFHERREVILEGKDWPPPFEQAIREERVENGMTKEMVELAWGHPAGVQALEGGAERWTFEHRRYDVHEDYYYDFYPGGSHLYYGFGPWGPRWGYAYTFPSWEPRYYRTYYARIEKRTVTFGPDGKVTGWEAASF